MFLRLGFSLYTSVETFINKDPPLMLLSSQADHQHSLLPWVREGQYTVPVNPILRPGD